MIPYANVRTALDRSAGRIHVLAGWKAGSRVQFVADVEGL